MNELITIQKMEQSKLAIREAKTLNEIKQIVDQSEALKAYARSAQLSDDIKAEAMELNLRAVRRLGEISTNMEKSRGGQPYQNKSTRTQSGLVETKTETLSSIGVTRQKANVAEKIALIPEDIFEETIEKAKTASVKLTKTMFSKYKKDTQLAEAKQSIIEQTKESVQNTPPIIRQMDCLDFINKCKPYDLLLTDPPYSTDIDDIESFVNKWLYPALERVKPTGSAYIFIGAYPRELLAYLKASIPDNVKLEQILIWTYKNTGGKIPNEHYKQNYQVCLYYRGVEAGALDNKDNEFWAVTEINAPDGRIGDRYHKWQKPIELAEMYIRHSTKIGDRIVDPFCCTGTFPLAAAKLGRIGLGADNNLENLQIAVNRGCIFE